MDLQCGWNGARPETAADCWGKQDLAGKTLAKAVSNFGATVKSKLTSVAITGAPEISFAGLSKRSCGT
jgi:hypothetical protein